MNSPFDVWRLRMSRAAEEQARLQKEEKQRLAAQAPPPGPVPFRPLGQTSGLRNMVAAVMERDRQAADALKPKPAPPPFDASQEIDASYALEFSRRMQNEAAIAIAKVESRKQWFEQTKEPK